MAWNETQTKKLIALSSRCLPEDADLIAAVLDQLERLHVENADLKDRLHTGWRPTTLEEIANAMQELARAMAEYRQSRQSEQVWMKKAGD